MSTYAAPIELINVALSRCGADRVSLNDGSREWEVAELNYEPIVKARMTKHRWSFLQSSQILVATAENQTEWRYGYARPSNCLTPHEARWCRQKVDYVQFDLELRFKINEPAITLLYTERKNEGYWPADFCEAMVMHLEAMFLSGLYEDRTRAREKREEADFEFEKAMIRDKNAQAHEPVTADPVIVAAHRGYRAPGK